MRDDMDEMLSLWARGMPVGTRYVMTSGGQFTEVMTRAIALRVPTTERRAMLWDEVIPPVLEDFRREARSPAVGPPQGWAIVEADGELILESLSTPPRSPALQLPTLTKATVVRLDRTYESGRRGEDTTLGSDSC